MNSHGHPFCRALPSAGTTAKGLRYAGTGRCCILRCGVTRKLLHNLRLLQAEPRGSGFIHTGCSVQSSRGSLQGPQRAWMLCLHVFQKNVFCLVHLGGKVGGTALIGMESLQVIN